MTLTLTIENVDRLDNGMPVEFVLNCRGATIGRAPTCDWCLPDPKRQISSRHCEISFRDGGYWLSDVSTNGTFLNNAVRLTEERELADGDIITIGRYTVRADIIGSVRENQDEAGYRGRDRLDTWGGTPGVAVTDSSDDDWGDARTVAGGWEGHGAPDAVQTDESFEWGARQSEPAGDGSQSWAPSHNASAVPHGHSVWEAPQAPPDPPSQWSSDAPDGARQPSPTDVWGKIADGNVVDWARGGFGQRERPRLADDHIPSGEGILPPSGRENKREGRVGARVGRRSPAGDPESAAGLAASGAASNDFLSFLGAATIPAEAITDSPSAVLARAGALIRALVGGLYVLVEARARAKAQLGAESTRLEFDGNNPLKFARSPEQALTQLLNHPERGFMQGERAIEDAFLDLQSHQMATLKAMQGALKATLDRFSPNAIRTRAAGGGVLGSIIPALRDAALWQAYEREFGGVARGSDEAFMDVFAKEFKEAYDEQSAQARHSAPR